MAKWGDIFSMRSSRIVNDSDTNTRFDNVDAQLAQLKADELAHYNAIMTKLDAMDAKLDTIVTQTA